MKDTGPTIIFFQRPGKKNLFLFDPNSESIGLRVGGSYVIEKGRDKSLSPQKLIICNKISLLLIYSFLRRSRCGWEENFEIERISALGPNFTGPIKLQCAAL